MTYHAEIIAVGTELDVYKRQVVEHILLRKLTLLRNHRQGVHRADADADAAAHAVQRTDGHGELIGALALAGLHVHDLGGLRGVFGLLGGQSEGTDGGMGADIGALVALDALCLLYTSGPASRSKKSQTSSVCRGEAR